MIGSLHAHIPRTIGTRGRAIQGDPEDESALGVGSDRDRPAEHSEHCRGPHHHALRGREIRQPIRPARSQLSGDTGLYPPAGPQGRGWTWAANPMVYIRAYGPDAVGGL